MSLCPVQKYNTLDNDGKKEMASKYSEHGPKDLTWAAAYIETSTHDEQTEREKIKGMCTRKEILDMEGIDTEGMPEKMKEEILNELLQQLWARLKTDPSKDPSLVADHRIPQMKKYYYEHDAKIKERETDTRSQSMNVQTTGFKMETAQKMLTHVESDPNIKIENPWHVELMVKVKAVWQAKGKLDKEETLLKDTLADFETAVHGKAGFDKIVKEYEVKLGVLTTFLTDLRKSYAKVSKIDPSDEALCKTALAEWQSFGEHMLIHQEGGKQMKAGMRAFIP